MSTYSMVFFAVVLFGPAYAIPQSALPQQLSGSSVHQTNDGQAQTPGSSASPYSSNNVASSGQSEPEADSSLLQSYYVSPQSNPNAAAVNQIPDGQLQTGSTSPSLAGSGTQDYSATRTQNTADAGDEFVSSLMDSLGDMGYQGYQVAEIPDGQVQVPGSGHTGNIPTSSKNTTTEAIGAVPVPVETIGAGNYVPVIVPGKEDFDEESDEESDDEKPSQAKPQHTPPVYFTGAAAQKAAAGTGIAIAAVIVAAFLA
ncbi:hypothetical protein BDZ91DRAFT_764099 [Kalaharituber pfeilii]|nr:hypothetical protein BDZ91DRAFT_764099 [Kalaharituber pfeilii]